jgi:hypothetical protein
MKALSLWEPWASAIALGLKKIETRGWATTYSGPLAIHAAQRKIRADDGVDELLRCVARKQAEVAPGWPRALPYGCVVAVVELVGCFNIGLDGDVLLPYLERNGTIYPVPEAERSWGNYDEGRFGWLLKNVRRPPAPIGARGAQGLWEWPESANWSSWPISKERA